MNNLDNFINIMVKTDQNILSEISRKLKNNNVLNIFELHYLIMLKYRINRKNSFKKG